MNDPTANRPLEPLSALTDPGPDPEFAARAAHYLRDQGLNRRAIALALRTELAVSVSDAVRLAGGHRSSWRRATCTVGNHPGGALALSPRSS